MKVTVQFADSVACTKGHLAKKGSFGSSSTFVRGAVLATRELFLIIISVLLSIIMSGTRQSG